MPPLAFDPQAANGPFPLSKAVGILLFGHIHALSHVIQTRYLICLNTHTLSVLRKPTYKYLFLCLLSVLFGNECNTLYFSRQTIVRKHRVRLVYLRALVPANRRKFVLQRTPHFRVKCLLDTPEASAPLSLKVRTL